MSKERNVATQLILFLSGLFKKPLGIALLLCLSTQISCKLDDNRLRGRIFGPTQDGQPPAPALPALSYSAAANYFSGGTLNLNPDLDDPLGLIESFSISPELPPGLSFNSLTGEISGTLPPLSKTTYSIEAHTAYGSVSFGVDLEIYFHALVNSTLDESDSDLTDGVCDSGAGLCTLRSALEQANSLKPLPARIEVPDYNFELTTGTELLIETNIELIGAGAGQTIIRQTAGATQRVLKVLGSEQVTQFTLDGVTIRDGNAAEFGGFGNGGGIYLLLSHESQFILRNCELFENHSGSNGGAVYIGTPLGTIVEPHILIDNCRFEGNSTIWTGGAISWFNAGPGHLHILNSQLKANQVPCCTYEGSALYMNGEGRITIENTEVLSNTGSDALYIAHHSNLIRMTNSTIASNGSGGLRLDDAYGGPVEIINSTFSSNGGPGIRGRRSGFTTEALPISISNSTFRSHNTHLQLSRGINLTLANSVFANASTANCSVGTEVTITSLGGNVAQGTNTCLLESFPTDLPSTDPLLDSAGLLYQSPEDLTQTIALQAASPARGFGVADYCPATDQVGKPRPAETSCDSGALEHQE